MARKLTKLRIDEVSSVDRGAGKGVKVMLYKRNNGDAVLQDDNGSYSYFPSWMAKQVTETHLTDTPKGARLFNDIMLEKLSYDGDEDDDASARDTDDTPEPNDLEHENVLPPRLEQMVAALISAAPALTREQAIHHLLHTAHGHALAEHLSSVTKTRKEPTPMNRSDQLRSIAKDFGVVKLAKFIVDDGPHGISEIEFTKMVSDEAQLHKLAGESSEKAFSRYFENNIDIRKAWQITKSTPVQTVDYMSIKPVNGPRNPDYMSIEPTMVGGEDAMDVNTDKSKAYDKLVAMADEQRRRSPELTVAQAFARVFEANPELAARAARRPTASSTSGSELQR
jgi:hypothetical protein